jgi:hypothetical protein
MEQLRFEFKGELLGDEQIKAMLADCPEIYDKGIKRLLQWAVAKTVGKKSKAKQELYAKKSRNSHVLWEKKFVNIVRGVVDKTNLTANVGVLYNTKKIPHEMMENFFTGYSLSKSNYMIIPNYKYLKSSNKEIKNIFRKGVNSNQFKIVFSNNKVLYFDKKTKQLWFYGTKQIRVKKQIDFWNLINNEMPAIHEKARTFFDRLAEKANTWTKFSAHDIAIGD